MAATLLALNAGAVITTGLWRHAGADEPAAKKTQAEAAQSPQAIVALPDSGVSVAGATVGGTAEQSVSDSPVNAIPIPESMPEIPSLPDAEALQNDPGFQEFRRLFAAEEESWSAAPPFLNKRSLQARSSAYFTTLDQRLKTVEKLCSAARSIASDAAIQAQRGSTDQSDELLRMATQLRDIAAKLLISEM